jgi:hypothetical protein
MRQWYSPDWVVIVIVHNDFDQSFLFHTGRHGSSFAKVHVVDGEVVGDIEAAPYRPRGVDRVRQSATVRYLFYNLNLRSAYWKFKLIRRFLYGQRDVDPEFEANVDTHVIATRWREVEAVTNYSFAELDRVVRGSGARLLLVMDGHRHAIYGGEDVTTVPPPDPETPDCDYAARGSLSIWSRRNWAGERCPCRSISQFSL